MRRIVIASVAAFVASATARADRSPVVSVAAMSDVRWTGDAGGQPSLDGGMRVTLAGHDLVEGYVGAGIRGELALAAQRLRPTIYLAARAIAIGRGVGGEAELAFGQSFVLHGWTRLGWEGAADLRPSNRDGEQQLDCLTTLYVGWKL